MVMRLDAPSHIAASTTVLGLVNVVIPFHDWELIKRNTPIELDTLLVKLLLELLNTTLLNFIGTELLQIVSKTHLLPHPNSPLGGIILPPLDGVSVIRWELVVEIVVSLTKGDQGSDHMITWRVAVIEWLVSKPVSE